MLPNTLLFIPLTPLQTTSGSLPISCWEHPMCGPPFQLAHRHSPPHSMLCTPHSAPNMAGCQYVLPWMVSVSLCRWPVSSCRKPSQPCEIGRKLTNLRTSEHCPRENKWEALSIRPGFEGSREGIHLKNFPKREEKVWNGCIHRTGLRKPQNPWPNWLVKVFLSWSQPVKTGGGVFIKCKTSNARLQRTQKIKEIGYHQRNNNFPVTNPIERWSQNCLTIQNNFLKKAQQATRENRQLN